MRAVVFLVPVLAIVLAMAYYAGRVHARNALRRKDDLLDKLLHQAQSHQQFGDPLATIVTDEIMTHRRTIVPGKG